MIIPQEKGELYIFTKERGKIRGSSALLNRYMRKMIIRDAEKRILRNLRGDDKINLRRKEESPAVQAAE